MNYFDHPYCSNSRLTDLGQELGLLPMITGNKEEAYRIGSLFDAVVTEPDKVNEIPHNAQEIEVMGKMKFNLEKNLVYQTYSKMNPDFQKELYVPDFSFGEFSLNMRAKLDFFVPGVVADLKSTTATSQKAFEASVSMFGYDRQMWLYCNLTGTAKAILFAVSKIAPYKVFVVQIKKGDKLWKSGEKMIKELAWRYYLTH